ncbi:MAG: Ku protein [Polyangiales bacterium]
MRAIWTGEISFGLVAIPVRLYAATKDLAPHFHYVHKKCGTKIVTVRRCPHCDVDVPWDDIVKGYEVSKGRYAKFSKKELESLEDEGEASGIDIAEFVDPGQVDLAYIEKSYWVGPAGKTTRGYDLLREALEKTEKAAIAKVKIRSRTRMALLRPREGRFALDMMRYGDELVDAGEVEVPKGHKAATARELSLALGLIAQLTAKTFDPSRHPDDYRAAVARAVDEKVAEDEDLTGDDAPVSRKAANDGHGRHGKVVDLAEILARSIHSAKSGHRVTKKHAPAAAARHAKTGARKAPARKTAHRKAS